MEVIGHCRRDGETHRTRAKSGVLVALLASILQMPLNAQSRNAAIWNSFAAEGSSSGSAHLVAGSRVPDVQLLDQYGKTVHFYSDLVKGKVVVINTIFTTCTTICPLAGANFSQLLKMMDGQAVRDVSLISISVDPTVDTPERLLKWGRQFAAGPGWTLLTGSKSNVESLLKALALFTADKQTHTPFILIGRDGPGAWTRTTAGPVELSKIVKNVRSLSAPTGGLGK